MVEFSRSLTPRAFDEISEPVMMRVKEMPKVCITENEMRACGCFFTSFLCKLSPPTRDRQKTNSKRIEMGKEKRIIANFNAIAKDYSGSFVWVKV